MWDGSEVTSMQEQAKAELDTILSSPAFLRSQRMAGLLRYLCSKYFSGQSEQVKEYNIAVEVFGRPETFDPVDDAIARVEVHRLRKKLREYYEREGANHELRLVIPTGSYAPAFVPAEKPSEAGVVAVAEPVLTQVSVDLGVPPAPLRPVASEAIPPRRLSWLTTLLAAAVAILAFVEFTYHLRPKALAASVEPARSAILPADRNPEPVADSGMNALAGKPVRLACGQTRPFRDPFGQTWGADQFFSGGTPFRRPAALIARAADPVLFDQGRSGLFGYDIPAAPGNYDLHLFFAETEYGPGNAKKGGDGSRVFHVSLNGNRILNDFDVLADAGGANIADERVFKNVTPGADGQIHLRFISRMGDATVNAIQLVPARPNRLNPVRIVVYDQPIQDALGRTWEPDRFYNGGQVAVRKVNIEGARDSRVYRNERYGNFTYAIPVADGLYDVTLYLAETYWGPENPGGGGAGSRVFDVFCNGEALVRNFDIYRETGAGRALVERFRGLKPNAQGKLTLAFVPEKNYASVYAIEVVDSSL
jgi:hypothetical protein